MFTLFWRKMQVKTTFIFLKKCIYLFYILTTVPSPSSPPISFLPIPFKSPPIPILCFCSKRRRPPMVVNKACHIKLGLRLSFPLLLLHQRWARQSGMRNNFPRTIQSFRDNLRTDPFQLRLLAIVNE